LSVSKRGDDHLLETSLSSAQVFKGRLLDVRRDEVRLPDGQRASREYIVHPGAVMVIPVLDDGRLLFERQYRFPLQRVLIEFPAGKIDPGEDRLATAQRELLEETGYVARRWSPMGLLHPVVSYSTEQIDIYLAEGLDHEGARLDEGEFVETFATTLEEALGWLDRGELTDGKTMLGLLLYARRIGRA
jgi:ADP-ribose pyrophosphatase